MIQLPPMPRSIAKLHRDSRGYPVPWFVAWVNGLPEFRCVAPGKIEAAIQRRLCWVCGEPLASSFAFVIGPMCAVNRVSSEPPSHKECAVFSAKACPFLSKPKAQRREANLPDGDCAGFGIKRNPGVTLLWIARTYSLFDDGNGGILFKIPDPEQVLWYSEGRKATRAEILESIDTGLPILREMAEAQGAEAITALEAAHRQALVLLPA